MSAIDYDRAAAYLQELFPLAESILESGAVPPVSPLAAKSADILFASSVQSYREVLLGCGLARMLDSSINIRHPYVSHSEDAFNGRTLDERVVNPFFQDRLIPSSKGPYLAIFRRSVKLVPGTMEGLRDKIGYQALLDYLAELEAADEPAVKSLVVYLLYRFAALRDSAVIPLSRISRLSLEQYDSLILRLLAVPSGGLIPVLLTVAMIRAIRHCYSLPWEIEWQGINVSDRASGVGGDVTVSEGGQDVLAIEITERPIERSRVVSTFNTKIVRAGIEEYLFVYSNSLPADDARQAARQYFSQGHEINFVQIQAGS